MWRLGAMMLYSAMSVQVMSWHDVAIAQFELRVTEIDYDQPGSDTAEWVEIFNTQDYEYSLEHVAVVFYDGSAGSCTEYCRVNLSSLGFIGSEEYLVLGVHPCASLPLCSGLDAIQNEEGGVICIEKAGELVFGVEYGSSLASSACSQLPEWMRTSAVDSDTEPGAIYLSWSCSPPTWEFAPWRFTRTPTPCAPTECVATDVPILSPVMPWGVVKALYTSEAGKP